MSERAEDITAWLQALPPATLIGVDAGGLCLRVDGEGDAYYEIGGLREEGNDSD